MSKSGNLKQNSQLLQGEGAFLVSQLSQPPCTPIKKNHHQNTNTFYQTLSPLPFPPKVEQGPQPHSNYFSSQLIIVETPLPKQHTQIYHDDAGEYAIQSRIIFQSSGQDCAGNSSQFQSSSIDQAGESQSRSTPSSENEEEQESKHSREQGEGDQEQSSENQQGEDKPKRVPKHRSTNNNNSSTKQVPSNKKVVCNCKKTKCLKLYCDCFRLNQTCDGCNCVGCHNLQVYNQQRNNAILALMDRNPDPFGQKIEDKKHVKGCNCKKSNCLKKYCECYQAGLKCGQNCKCDDCKNCTDRHLQGDKGAGGKNTAKKQRKMVEM